MPSCAPATRRRTTSLTLSTVTAAHALLAAGFEDLGPMKLHPGEFDGHIEHMMAPGENYVPMHAYRFNRGAIDKLIHDLWTFWHGGRELSRSDPNLRVKVAFSGMVDPAFLDAGVERIAASRSPT